MQTFTEKSFNLTTLDGISPKAIEEHLKLYAGYVKNANTVLAKIDEYSKDSEAHAYALGELQRRFSFEFDGMRNHEVYFHHFEGGAQALSDSSPLREAITGEFGSFDAWLNRFKSIALTRGIGWAMLYYDKVSGRLLNQWVDEQHLGHLTGLTPILALDMWEHSYLFDYVPADKKKYVEAFFANLNWQTCEENFAEKNRREISHINFLGQS